MIPLFRVPVLREQNTVFVLASLIGIPLLFIKKRWAVRAMQLFFVLASIEWVHTMLVLMMERKAMGLPWMRMAAILTAVAAFTLLSSLTVSGIGSLRVESQPNGENC